MATAQSRSRASIRRAGRLSALAAVLAMASLPAMPAPVTQASQASTRVAAVDDADLSKEDLPKLIRQQRMEILQLKRDAESLAPNDPARQQKLRAVTALEQRIQREAVYPRRRYLSPAVRQPVYAAYYDSLTHRIEVQGTRNYPMRDGQRLHGELTLSITIDVDGRIVETEIIHGSGDALLDQKAVQIARSAAPFGPFSPAMRALADQIVVSPRFRFIKGAEPAEATRVD